MRSVDEKGRMMKALKWHQVHAWRLSQHGLSPRLSSGDVVEAVRRTAGIQAQGHVRSRTGTG